MIFLSMVRAQTTHFATFAVVSTGNGSKPTIEFVQPGCCSVAPLWPHSTHRADRRSLSLDVSAPQRMMSGTSAVAFRR